MAIQWGYARDEVTGYRVYNIINIKTLINGFTQPVIPFHLCAWALQSAEAADGILTEQADSCHWDAQWFPKHPGWLRVLRGISSSWIMMIPNTMKHAATGPFDQGNVQQGGHQQGCGSVFRWTYWIAPGHSLQPHQIPYEEDINWYLQCRIPKCDH